MLMGILLATMISWTFKMLETVAWNMWQLELGTMEHWIFTGRDRNINILKGEKPLKECMQALKNLYIALGWYVES